MREPLGACMRAVGRGKGVIAKNISKICDFFCKILIILLFFGIKSGIFKQKYLITL